MPSTRRTLASGTQLQTGLSPDDRTPSSMPAVFVRGVVIATYVVDDPHNPDNVAGATATAIYCDVLTYTSAQGGQRVVLPRCLVCQDFGGMQQGVVYKPRAASLDVSGQPLDLATCAIGQLDGDHVLCSFLDGARNQPIIVRGMPHPAADTGNAAGQGDFGAHLKLRLVDGSPWYIKNHGAFFGIDDAGSFVRNTLYANDGSVQSDGSEPGPPTSGALGNHLALLHAQAAEMTQFYDMTQPAAPQLALQKILNTSQMMLQFMAQPTHLVVTDAKGNSLDVSGSGPNTKAVVGSGDVHVAIAEHMQTLYANLTAYLNTHLHPTPVGASGPPTTPAPNWDPSINSTKVALPDG